MKTLWVTGTKTRSRSRYFLHNREGFYVRSRFEACEQTVRQHTCVSDFNAVIRRRRICLLPRTFRLREDHDLRMVAGFLEPTEGEVFIGQRLVSSAEQRVAVPPEKRHIGMVFQSYAVWPHKNVFDNVAYPLRIQKKKKTEIQEKVQHVLGLVKLSGMEDRYPHQLSGGQQQRVALGRALVMEPDVFAFLTNPSPTSTPSCARRCGFEIKDLQSRIRVTIIHVTHDQAEAMAMSDRIFVMNAGRTLQVGSPKDIYEEPADRFVADLSASRIFSLPRCRAGPRGPAGWHKRVSGDLQHSSGGHRIGVDFDKT